MIDERPPSALRAARIRRTSPSAKPGRGLRVLIVEDEAIIALGLEQMVEALGHDVCGMADSADDAVAAAERQKPDLVLMDINLRGGTDGVEAASRIWRSVGVRSLFMSAMETPTVRSRASAAHPVGFLPKPYGMDDLRRLLDNFHPS